MKQTNALLLLRKEKKLTILVYRHDLERAEMAKFSSVGTFYPAIILQCAQTLKNVNKTENN